MAGQFTLQLNSCVMVGIILGYPLSAVEIWLFIKPALHENERKSASGFVFFASVLFFIGICLVFHHLPAISQLPDQFYSESGY